MKDCSVLWSGIYFQNGESNPHCHEFFQMVGILSGSGTIQIDDKKYDIQKEHFYLFKPQEIHSIRCSDEAKNQLKLMDIKFSITDALLFEQLIDLGNCFTVNDFNFIRIYFDKIINESNERQPFYYPLINCHLYEILIRIIRDKTGYRQSGPAVSEINGQKTWKGVDIEALLNYVHGNYSTIITLDDLSEMAKINKTTLIGIFKDVFHTTPIRYINSFRLERAKELLTNTDISISEIAELIGFQSIHNFSRHFKGKENCTPIEYRMFHKQNKYFTY